MSAQLELAQRLAAALPRRCEITDWDLLDDLASTDLHLEPAAPLDLARAADLLEMLRCSGHPIRVRTLLQALGAAGVVLRDDGQPASEAYMAEIAGAAS